MELYESCACSANAKDNYLNIEDKRRLRVMQTTNRHLQEQLVYWQAQLAPLAVPPPSDAVETFVRGEHLFYMLVYGMDLHLTHTYSRLCPS